jgi:hypothetical protein
MVCAERIGENMETRYVDVKDRLIFLGINGENRARKIVFDVKCWVETYGEGGSAALVARRNGDEEPYPAVISFDGENVEWILEEADVEKPGKGVCELHYLLNGTVAKSKTFETLVNESVGGTDGKAPEPQKAWVDKVLKAADDIMNAGGGEGGGGSGIIETDETLIYKDGKLSVNTTNQAEADNTRPITSSGVYAIVGNIGAILDTI